MDFLTNVSRYFGAEVLVVPGDIFSSCIFLRLSCGSKCSLIVAALFKAFLVWWRCGLKQLYTALNVWIVTGLSTLLTDCGGLPSLVQGLNVLEIRSKVMLCTTKRSLKEEKAKRQETYVRLAKSAFKFRS